MWGERLARKNSTYRMPSYAYSRINYNTPLPIIRQTVYRFYIRSVLARVQGGGAAVARRRRESWPVLESTRGVYRPVRGAAGRQPPHRAAPCASRNLQSHDHGGALLPGLRCHAAARLGAACVTAAPPPSRGLAARAARLGTAPGRVEGARGWAACKDRNAASPRRNRASFSPRRPGAGPGQRLRCPTAPLGAASLFRPRRHEAELPAAAGVRALQHGLHGRPRLLEHER